MTRLVRRHPEAVELVEKVSAEVAAGDSVAGKRGLGITHSHSALLLEPKKQDALLFIDVAAVQRKNKTKEKRTAALLTSRAF